MPATLNEHIGNKILNRRMALYLSQEELAERIGLTRYSIISYEWGQTCPTAAKLYEIACVLRCNVSDFFKGWKVQS